LDNCQILYQNYQITQRQIFMTKITTQMLTTRNVLK